MKKIVVADREEALCLLYQEELTEEGYEVVTVNRIEDLIQAVGQEDPDLVLMDAGIDGHGASEVLQGLRQSGYHLPVILCTTYFGSKGFPEALIDDIVIKSSNLEELKFKIGNMLGNGCGPVSPGSGLG